VLFLSRDALDAGTDVRPDSAWLAENAHFLRAADAVVAPSDYIADLARRHIEGLQVQVVPNGSTSLARTGGELRARPEFAEHRPRHVAVVLGAIGPHKGSDILEALGEALRGSDIAIVVIGYLDRQVVPGWRHPGTLFIHGAYSDDEVPGLMEAYGAEIALFPNRAPESFSYTLSDAWSCGLPVLAAARGALGERVSRHGGGWLLPADFDAPAVAKRLRELLSEGAAGELARVRSQLSRPDPARVPSLEAMARSIEALYARFGIDADDPGTSSSAAIERLLATNLDGSLFRPELARAADELAQALRSNEELVATVERARAFEAHSREWIAKLERDIEALQSRRRARGRRASRARRGSRAPSRKPRSARAPALAGSPLAAEEDPRCAKLTSASSPTGPTSRSCSNSSPASPNPSPRRRAVGSSSRTTAPKRKPPRASSRCRSSRRAARSMASTSRAPARTSDSGAATTRTPRAARANGYSC
jgi:glycosyltransferase involved in cell wall biosynthesis